MSDKATCPSCGAHTSAMERGRCPNGCGADVGPAASDDRLNAAAQIDLALLELKVQAQTWMEALSVSAQALARVAEMALDGRDGREVADVALAALIEARRLIALPDGEPEGEGS